MKKMAPAISLLSAIPMRKEPSDRSEMVNQVLFGETMEILDQNEKWFLAKLQHDNYEGWLDKKQVAFVEGFLPNPQVVKENLSVIRNYEGMPQILGAGSLVEPIEENKFRIGPLEYLVLGGNDITLPKPDIKASASMFFGTPYLWGGRTLFGMDCSGFTQIAFRLAGKSISRDASQQALQGSDVTFVEESRTGDLAFFDNSEGKITHVGIVLEHAGSDKRSIIHCSGQVRIDAFDHQGIYHAQSLSYTHNLRLIKRL